MPEMISGSNTDISKLDETFDAEFSDQLRQLRFEVQAPTRTIDIKTRRSIGFFSRRDSDPTLYVTIWATTHYRADCDHLDVTLREGTIEYPDSRFNFITLSELVCHRDPERRRDEFYGAGIYVVPQKLDHGQVLQRLSQLARVAAADLFTHGDEFLKGSLEEFKEVRRAKNRAKRDYWEQFERDCIRRVAAWRKYAEL